MIDAEPSSIARRTTSRTWIAAWSIDPSDTKKSINNLQFLIRIGLLKDPEGGIVAAAKEFAPTLSDDPAPAGLDPMLKGRLGGALEQDPRQRTLLDVDPAERKKMPADVSGASAAGLQLLAVAVREIGVVEQSGPNSSPRIETYLAYAGLPGKSAGWSAAFVSYCLGQVGSIEPIRALTNFRIHEECARRGWLVATSKYRPVPGDVAFYYFDGGTNPRQVGIVFEADDQGFLSIEGNTGPPGSRSGVAVLKKRRRAGWKYRVEYAHLP